MKNVNFEFLQRFATEDRVVDDSIVTFEIAKEIVFDMGPPCNGAFCSKPLQQWTTTERRCLR